MAGMWSQKCFVASVFRTMTSLLREQPGSKETAPKTVLVVDDDLVSLRCLALPLRGCGYSVLESSSADQGLDLARRHGPDLTLSDYHMPGKDGLAFVRELRESASTKDIPVIFCTGFGDDPHFKESVRSHGVSQVLIKPCGFDQVLSAVQSAIGPAMAEVDARLSEAARWLSSRAPAYLSRRASEFEVMQVALSMNDLLKIQRIAHDMKGTGSAYGFRRISEIGERLELAARSGHRVEVARQLDELNGLLQSLPVPRPEVGTREALA